MKILFVITGNPWEESNGHNLKISQIIEAFSKSYKCDLVIFSKESQKNVEVSLKSKANISNIFVCKENTGFKLILARFMCLIRSWPMFFARYIVSLFKIRQSLPIEIKDYDFIFIDTFSLAHFINKDSRFLISTTDAISLTYKHASSESKSHFGILYRKWQTGLVLRAEKKWLEMAKVVHVVGKLDKDYYKSNLVKPSIICIPQAIDNSFSTKGRNIQTIKNSTKRLDRRNDGFFTITVCARFDSDTALGTLENFLLTVYDDLIKTVPEINLKILSGGNAKQVSKISANYTNITIKDWVDDFMSELCDSSIIALLDNFEMGIKTRALFSLASGVPVVATPQSVFGIGIKNDIHALIKPLGPQFKDAIVSIIDGQVCTESISIKAKEFINEEYAIKKHNERWIEYLNS